MVSGAKPGPQGTVCVEHSVPPRRAQLEPSDHVHTRRQPLTARSATSQRSAEEGSRERERCASPHRSDSNRGRGYRIKIL
jgi:hypothetical protein